MTIRGISAKIVLLTMLFFAGALFGWQHFHKRVEQLEKDFPQVAPIRTTWNETQTVSREPHQQMTSEQQREYVRRIVLTEPREQNDLNWKWFSWTRELKYPLFAWILVILSLAPIFLNRKWTGWLAPICVALEGVACGSLEMLFHQRYPGLTLTCLFVASGMLFTFAALFWFGLLERRVVLLFIAVGIAGSIALSYVAGVILGSFGYPVQFLHRGPGHGANAVFISFLVMGIIAVFSCAKIRDAVENGAPRWMEWHAALRIFTVFLDLALWFRRMVKENCRRALR